MKQLSLLIKPASSLCNLRCRYCFYADEAKRREHASFGMMTQETMRLLIDHAFADLEPGDIVEFAFQGGEPTLAGLPFYRAFSDYADLIKGDVSVRYAIQTNGILLDSEWCRFLRERKFLVGLSLDLIPGLHDQARVDENNRGTWKSVSAVLSLLKEEQIEHNVLCTLTNPMARHPKQVWNTIKKLGISYVQFTPCLGSPENEEKDPFALTPERFASFYLELFEFWRSELAAGNYISIKLFDDLACLLSEGRAGSCGMGGFCQPQLAVESDGSVYPCDFYCLDEFCLGNFREETVRELFERSAASPQKERLPLPGYCAVCPYIRLCGGGCKRMRREMCLSPGDRSCGYRTFLDGSIEKLHEILHAGRR